MLASTISFFSLLGLALAAPAQEPASIERRAVSEIQPSSVIFHTLYSSQANTCYNPGTAINIWRTGPWPDRGVSTLYTFTYPAGVTSSSLCWLEFTAGPLTSTTPSSYAGIDVFSSTAPASCTGGSSANYRNNNWGRLNVGSSGLATWAWKSGGLSSKQPCKPAGSSEWVELAATGDNTYLEYRQGAGYGLTIKYE
ncbi:hypothetical protein QBC44DRAFT_323015 [Cladorrhinum sp. PSN332]|nr:hypothetical protein QBC44DRAFT_323015 [Cladorrhinum sp. PSN332]